MNQTCRLCGNGGTYRGITGKVNYCDCPMGEKALGASWFDLKHIESLPRPEQLAWLVRRNVEQYAEKHRYSPSLKHLCGLSSAALLVALKREGFAAQMVQGSAFAYFHVWVLHRKKIIDTTFTQFNRNAPRVLIADKNDQRYRQERAYRTPRRIATNMVQEKWERDVSLIATIEMGSE